MRPFARGIGAAELTLAAAALEGLTLISNVALQPAISGRKLLRLSQREVVGALRDHADPQTLLGGAGHSVRVLQADPELGLRVPPEGIARAREELRAHVAQLDPGIWEVPFDRADQARFGFLVLEGLLARDLVLAGSTSTELVGEGDVLQRGEPVRDEGLVRYHVRWHVLSPVTVAILDDQFWRSLTQWPQVMGALFERAMGRTTRMTIHQALLHLSPVETRLLVLFWHLAERWGRVTRAGIELPVRLTHEMLGHLVGCQRASVTTALKVIAESGLAVRRLDGTWLLKGPPPDELSRLHWHRRHALEPAGDRAGALAAG